MEFDTEELTLVFNFLVPLSEGGWVEKKKIRIFSFFRILVFWYLRKVKKSRTNICMH